MIELDNHNTNLPSIGNPDAKLIRLCAEFLKFAAERHDETDLAFALKMGSPEYRAAWDALYAGADAYHEMMQQIAAIPAHGIGGLAANARVFAFHTSDGADLSEPVGWSIARDLLAMEAAQ